MYVILQLEYNYRSTTNILKSSAIITDFTDSIISINCCFKSISKSPSCSSDNCSLYILHHIWHRIPKHCSVSFLVSFYNCLSWLGHRDPKNAKGPGAWYTPLLWQKWIMLIISGPLDMLILFCRQYICVNNINHFDYSTYYINIYFSISMSC